MFPSLCLCKYSIYDCLSISSGSLCISVRVICESVLKAGDMCTSVCLARLSFRMRLFIFVCMSPRGRRCCWSGRWIRCQPGTGRASRWGKRKPRRQSAWSQRTRSWWRPSPPAAATAESSEHPARSAVEGEEQTGEIRESKEEKWNG